MPVLAGSSALAVRQTVGAAHFADGKLVVTDIETLFAIDQYKVLSCCRIALLVACRTRHGAGYIARVLPGGKSIVYISHVDLHGGLLHYRSLFSIVHMHRER